MKTTTKFLEKKGIRDNEIIPVYSQDGSIKGEISLVELLETFSNKNTEFLRKQNGQLKNFCKWMTGCGFDFESNDYFRDQRDKLLT